MSRTIPTVTVGRPLIAIVYKYNTRKVFSFIFTFKTGSTQEDLTYLFNYPSQFYNISIYAVNCPLVLYEIFGYVNVFDSHKKSRHSDLEMKKF